jgi:hypothetical protein
MGVRPIHGLVAIARCASRSEAGAAARRLTAAGIDALVVEDQPQVTGSDATGGARFSVLVPLAVADDAQQVLVRAAPPPPSHDPSALVHPALRPRPDPDAHPVPAAAPDDHHGGGTAHDDPGGDGPSMGRPPWVKLMAWVMVASVLLPLVLSALRAVSQL